MSMSNVTFTPANNNPKQDEAEEKPRTIFIGNIPADASKYEIESIFGEIGPLKRLHFQYPKFFHKTQSEPIVGYVTFALPEDATSAASNKTGYSLRGNKLAVKLSKNRSNTSGEDQHSRPPRAPRFQTTLRLQQEKEDLPKPKPPREKSVKKKARLIIRNLSFQVTEDNIKEHFAPYGDIRDINILKKPSGKLVGCAFVQYAKVSQAAKALRDLNLKPFLARPIAIDWALPKNKFQGDDDVKEEPEDEKPEMDETITVKEEPESESESKPHDSDDSDSDDDVKPAKKVKPESSSNRTTPRPLNPNDADEGKTLFLRNLNFDTTSEGVKEFFQQFGPVNYAVICKDRLTEHSKGTAFVKFRAESALSECLQKYNVEPAHFVLDDRQFYMSQALSRSKLNDTVTSTLTTQKEPKDKRNLYLVREGFIRPGTTAAEGMSPTDVALRATIYHHKRQMLKDLNNFISDTRLCIHNLPEKLSDRHLRSLVVKEGGVGAKVTEARIMRDKKAVSGTGFKSKGFGFVTFTEHIHALAALRALNNNPQTFSKHKRPIVEFSLEKRAALKAKAKRMERSREKLKKIPSAHETQETTVDESESVGKSSRKRKRETPESNQAVSTNPDSELVPNFGGLVSDKGLKTIPSLKPKGKRTKGPVGKVKPKKLLPRRKRQKKTVPAEKSVGKEDRFEKLVSVYKQKNYDDTEEGKGGGSKKKKWYA